MISGYLDIQRKTFNFQIYQPLQTTLSITLLNKEAQAVKDRTATKLKICLKGNNYLSAFSAVMLPYKVVSRK